MTEEYVKHVPTQVLRENEDSIKGEISSLEHDLKKIENELFYRKNPECSPNKT